MQEKIRPALSESTKFWTKLGCISFGGPAAQIPLMHQELVLKRKWISENQFAEALALANALPGPEAQQMATYFGWKMHGVKGGLISGSLYILPSAFLLLAMSYLYVWFGRAVDLEAFLLPLRAVVLAMIIHSLVKLFHSRIRSITCALLATLSLVNTELHFIPFSLLLMLAALFGSLFLISDEKSDRLAKPKKPSIRLVSVAVSFVFIWLAPLAIVAYLMGFDHRLTQVGIFFSKTALVTFGGAYAILPHVSTTVVNSFHWIKPGEMLDTLSLAESTPGPLVIVLQFVGFLACWHSSAPFSPEIAALLGALLSSWATFIPSFIWIFAIGPFADYLFKSVRIRGALTAVLIAVVGSITHLSVWFAYHSMHNLSTMGLFGFSTLAVLGLILQFYRDWSVAKLVTLGFVFSIVNYLAW